MPAPKERDLTLTRSQLLPWLAQHMPGCSRLGIGEMTGPGGTGFSSDTLLFDLDYVDEAGESRRRPLVVRIEPSGFPLFPEYDLDAQYGIMKALADTEVAVPQMSWRDTSGEVIGAPFYLMERIEGRAPADNPPYCAEGWLFEMSPEEQRALWHGYIEQLAAIHRLDPVLLGLDFLAKPQLGDTPLDQELSYYERFYRFALSPGDAEHPYVSRSLAWLRENQPPQPSRPRLCWGDARIGNMLFQGTRCVAVLDWEMARLGDPVMDLAWGLFVGRYHTEGNGLPPLPGFPSREETVALYEELRGVGVEHLPYYEILAGMRFSVILLRLTKQFKHYEMMPADSNFEVENPVSQLHGKQLRDMGLL